MSERVWHAAGTDPASLILQASARAPCSTRGLAAAARPALPSPGVLPASLSRTTRRGRALCPDDDVLPLGRLRRGTGLLRIREQDTSKSRLSYNCGAVCTLIHPLMLHTRDHGLDSCARGTADTETHYVDRLRRLQRSSILPCTIPQGYKSPSISSKACAQTSTSDQYADDMPSEKSSSVAELHPHTPVRRSWTLLKVIATAAAFSIVTILSYISRNARSITQETEGHHNGDDEAVWNDVRFSPKSDLAISVQCTPSCHPALPET